MYEKNCVAAIGVMHFSCAASAAHFLFAEVKNEKRKEIVVKFTDNLGRVLIPKEYREFYRFGENINIISTEKAYC